MSSSQTPSTERHWADRTAETVLARGVTRPVVVTGISPSGAFHIGHLREILTGDAVVRALRDRGSDARLVFVVDNLDPLRKVPVQLDPQIYTPLLGRCLFDVPAPDGEGSYDEYFLRPFLGALAKLRVEPDVTRARDLYASGRMTDVIFTALERTAQIKAILQEVSGKQEMSPTWSPWNPRCPHCRRIDKGEVEGWDRAAGTIRSRCLVCGETAEQPAAASGKLTWRVDWAARWKALGASAEPFGKDHASRGGSYDTGVRFAREVFGMEPPVPLVYEWISLKGQGDMSSSRGNVLAADDLLQLVPPEVVRYLVMKARPNRGIEFDPGKPLLRLVDEVDDAASTDRDDRALELSREAGFKPAGVPFKHLILVAQIAGFDLERTLAILAKNGYRDVDRDAIRARIAMARVWLERFAPADDDIKVSVAPGVPDGAKALSAAQKGFLRQLAVTVGALSDADAIQNEVHRLSAAPDGPGGKPAFEAIYQALLGRPRGPRAGSFIAFLGPEFAAQRFDEVARS